MIPTNMKTKILNLISDIAAILAIYYFYSKIAYFKDYFSFEYWGIISALDIFFFIASGYIIFLIPYRLIKKKQEESKSLIAIRALLRKFYYLFSKKRPKISSKEKTAILSILVRAFFLPLMINWAMGHFVELYDYSQTIFSHNLPYLENIFIFFNRYLFWLIFSLILFVDTIYFSFGYLVESDWLGSKIRSVEPTLLGWLVAVLCYPPFNILVMLIFPWQSQNGVNDFSSPITNSILNVLIIILMGIYGWATLALGSKASNLTNRGTVSRGPYGYVRHPAYISKNLSWWIGAFPAIQTTFNHNTGQFFFILICLLGWSFLYYLRAVTEERHLGMDPDYRKYCKMVKWRFIPGVI